MTQSAEYCPVPKKQVTQAMLTTWALVESLGIPAAGRAGAETIAEWVETGEDQRVLQLARCLRDLGPNDKNEKLAAATAALKDILGSTYSCVNAILSGSTAVSDCVRSFFLFTLEGIYGNAVLVQVQMVTHRLTF